MLEKLNFECVLYIDNYILKRKKLNLFFFFFYFLNVLNERKKTRETNTAISQDPGDTHWIINVEHGKCSGPRKVSGTH